jgi:hypothetical protein
MLQPSFLNLENERPKQHHKFVEDVISDPWVNQMLQFHVTLVNDLVIGVTLVDRNGHSFLDQFDQFLVGSRFDFFSGDWFQVVGVQST